MSAVRIVLAALTSCCISFAAGSCWALPEGEYHIDIPRQPLELALLELGRQLDVSVGYYPAGNDDGQLAGPVNGVYRNVDRAIDELLRGTDFQYIWSSKDTLSVFPKRVDASPRSRRSYRSPRSSAAAAGRDELEFVIVTGTRLSSARAEWAPMAAQSRREIQSYGVSTLAELIEYLPQVPFVRSEDYRASGEQYADLRGLGPGTTLVLINGRRIAPTATSYDNGGFDLNTIPLTAVRKVEVRLDSPSVALGTDAIGGVINILLENDIPSPVMELRYGAAKGGAEERRFSLGAGMSRGRFHGVATFDAFHRSALLGAERDFTRNQDFRRFGGQDFRSIDASPGNITSLTGANLPGLSSPFAAVPIGSGGIEVTPADFVATAGQRNLTSLGRYRSIVPETSRASVVATGEIEVKPGLVVFGEFLGTSRSNEFQFVPPTLTGMVVPASNPFNPFGVPVAVNTLLRQVESRTFVTNTDLIRAATGAQGDWRGWEGEVSAVWTREQASFWRENEVDPLHVMQALASPSTESALNVFRDGPAGSPELLASLRAPRQIPKYSSDTTQVYARAQRPVFAVPAGDTTMAMGADWRREGLSNPALSSSSLHRSVSGAFAEVQLPIIEPAMHVPAVRHLMLSGGTRIDDYDENGSTTTEQFGLVWYPVRDIKFRASYSTSYRPPSIYELHAPGLSVPAALPDPHRNNEMASFVVIGGGNPDLRPSAGDSWTVGLDFDPRELLNLHASLSYWRISIQDPIAPLAMPVLIGHDDLFPGRVTRAERTAQDIDAGLPGTLRSVNLSPGNFGHMQASGADFSISMDWATSIGRFIPKLSAAWTDTFSRSIASGLPPEQRVDIASPFGTIPTWRGVAGLEWIRGPLTLFSAARFVSAYDDIGVPSLTRNGRGIPSQTTLDVQATLQLDSSASSESSLSGVKLTAGITNLFDRGPHFAEVGFDRGSDPSQSDLRQRFWYVRLTKEF